LPAGLLQSLADFLTVEGCSGAVFLHDFDGPLFAALEGGVLPAAGQTLATAANGETPFAGRGFQHAIVLVVAERTLDRVIQPLIRVVARLAAETLAAAANGKPVVTGPRVNNLVVIHAALRTLHSWLATPIDNLPVVRTRSSYQEPVRATNGRGSNCL